MLNHKSYQYYLKNEPSSSARRESIAMAGNCSTEALAKVIRGYFAEEKIDLHISECDYDTVNLSVLDDASPIYQNSVSFLFLYYSPLKLRDDFYKTEDKRNFADQFLVDFHQVITRLKNKNIKVLVTSLPTTLERCFGNASAVNEDSLIFQLQKINQNLKQTIQANSHCLLLDIEHLANRVGLDNFHSEKLWSMGKYPCHTNFYPNVASEIFRVYQATQGQIKKVLALDLDNTLWNGIIAEDGPDAIEPFADFQYYLKSLKDKGFLLVVCSKNNYENAILPFKGHPEMILKEEDFAVFIANWEPKSTNLKVISKTLNIGLDAFVFIDDSAFERNEVRHSLPEVLVPELSDDPTEYISLIDRAGFLENHTHTESDANRTLQYRQETERLKQRDLSGNIEDYLKSLGMTCKVEQLNSGNLERAAQLIQRSNQFNLRTQRLSKSDLEKISTDKNYISLCFSLKDKFGDAGMISVIVCEINRNELFIKELVMSCRVLKRGMESFLFNKLIDVARERSLEKIKAEYIPTEKNSMVESLLPQYGFENSLLIAKEENKTQNYITGLNA